MSFKSRKTNDLINSTMEDDRGRSSVFDRLGAKQLTLQQNYQNRSNSNKLQQTKYEPSDFSDSSTLYDSYKLNSDNKKINEGASSYDKNFYNQDSYDLSFQNDERFFKAKKNQKKMDNFSESEKHLIKNKHIKSDSDFIKKNYIDQNSELLEKRRIELTRELQKIDQRDKKLVLNKHRHQKNVLKSPCSNSSNSNCSSSSSSGSESYSESSGSCSSSCTSSSFSDEAGVPHHKHKNRSKKNLQNQKKVQNFLLQEEISSGNKQSHLKKKSPSPFSKMNKKIKKDPSLESMQNYNSIMSKKLRSRSPQSTASSYYSRKSRGPLTPPPPSIHHSHQSQQSINTNASTSIVSDNIKLDRHGNVRVSLKEKERQRKINEMQQQVNTSPLYSSSQSLSHSKTRSPSSKSKEDMYLISEDKKRLKDPMNTYYKENTPSPIHFKHEIKNRKNNPNLNNFEDYKTLVYEDNQRYENRPTSSFYYKQSSSRQKNDNNQARLYSINYDKSESNPYISPNDNRYNHYPQTPPNTFNKNKEQEKKASRLSDYNYNHENVNQNKNFVKTNTFQRKSNNEDIQFSRNPNLAHSSKNYDNSSKQNDYVNNYLSRVSISSSNSNPEKNVKQSNYKYQELSKNSELSKKSLDPKSENLVLKELSDQVDEISSISNNSLEDVDVSLDDVGSVKNENTFSLKDESKADTDKKNEFIDEKSTEKIDSIDVSNDKINENESKLKNDEFFSDENLSEWSDVEDYDTLNNEDFEQTNIEQSKNIDQFDDLKVKIEEELEAISDEEFDAIIDDQDENEKNGFLSCKQVLDQLNINWGSLVQRDLDDEKIEDLKSSASIRFKPARILSHIGISKKHIDENLFKKIKKFCGEELNDEKFDFESPIAMTHLIKKKKNRENSFSNLDISLNSSCYSDFYDVELRKFLSNGNVFERKSFNHLIKKLN